MADDRSDKRHLRLVTNADVQRLIESREGSGFVTMLHPLELFMSRDLLRTLTHDSLDRIRTSRKADETENEALAVARAVQQRVDFLAWLTTQATDEVYMAVYPSDMDGLDDLDDLLDIPDEGGSQLPF